MLHFKCEVCFTKCGGDSLKNRIQELRKKKRMTQEELANEVNVSRRTIISLENGQYNPSILLAFAIADFFELNIEEVFIYERER